MTAAAPRTFSVARARRIALAAQGFADPAHRTPTMRTLTRTVERTGVLQVDSVNVLQRAHYMPLYSRMGGYDVDLLRRASQSRPRRLVEYWAHVQALMPVELWPVMRHRMAAYAERRAKFFDDVEVSVEHAVLAAVRERGGVTARDLEAEFQTGPRTKEHWGWNWSASRKALDLLYMSGRVAIAGRNAQFEVVYDLPERVIPDDILGRPTPSLAEAHRELVRRAARSHGIATLACLSDYYRMKTAETKVAVDSLVAEGELLPAVIEGWRRPAYLHRDARIPRRIGARALLSPFDPVVWQRERAEALFGFHYRIEIYVPEQQRVHGYYVLPFLLGEHLVGRVDLKADRAAGVLVVQAAHREPDAPPETASELAAELDRLAGWLGLSGVEVRPRGELAPALAAAVA